MSERTLRAHRRLIAAKLYQIRAPQLFSGIGRYDGCEYGTDRIDARGHHDRGRHARALSELHVTRPSSYQLAPVQGAQPLPMAH